MNTTKKKLLAAGVRNLKEFGYPGVTTENILTDQIYRAFFRSMLENTPVPDAAELIAEIDRDSRIANETSEDAAENTADNLRKRDL